MSNEWQPIETAPKNPSGESYGPYILIFHEYDRHIYESRWECRGDVRGWYAVGLNKPLFTDHVKHWMPLPNPPKQEA